MKVLLFGEGNTDVTTVPTGFRGALAILLTKVVEASGKQCEISGARLPRLQKGSGYPRKIDLAIALAHSNGAEAVPIVVDRDGHAPRLRLLKDGREQAKTKAGAPHSSLAWRTAVGVAVEMLEAWLIADTAAVTKFVKITGALPEPETLPNPKERINELLDEAGVDAAEGYDQIASATDIHEIERRCPAFREFAQEVRTLILPREQ